MLSLLTNNVLTAHTKEKARNINSDFYNKPVYF